jgi:hypothetical protein
MPRERTGILACNSEWLEWRATAFAPDLSGAAGIIY